MNEAMTTKAPSSPNEMTTIAVSKTFKAELDKLGAKGDRYETILWRVLQFYLDIKNKM